MLSKEVYPANVQITASADYVFAGSGSISGSGSLIKTGTGTLSVSNANAYAGTTIIGVGEFIVGNNSALGDITAGTVVSNGASIDLNGCDIGDEQLFIAGTGSAEQGALINDNPTNIGNVHLVELTADTTVGGKSRWDMRGGSQRLLNLGGHTLSKSGTGNIILVSTVISNGTVVINEGGLAIEGSATTTPGVDQILVNTNGTLALASWNGNPDCQPR
jgi:autotransporter-associated beta strand protein